jgi:TRAP transporter TAXI family solute receptor
MIYTVGHPAGRSQEAATTCDVELVSVAGEPIDKLVADNPFYPRRRFPAACTRADADVSTFGVGATFVSSADVSEDAVYTVVKAVFDNFDDFKKLHPAFSNLSEEADDPTAYRRRCMGAEKYYKERGWM